VKGSVFTPSSTTGQISFSPLSVFVCKFSPAVSFWQFRPNLPFGLPDSRGVPVSTLFFEAVPFFENPDGVLNSDGNRSPRMFVSFLFPPR